MVARKPKSHTLQRSSQFRTCYTSGKKVVCEHVVVFYYPVRTRGGGLHVGVVASKRVGNAVKRNRAKRLLREAARHVADRVNNRDIWIVLVAKSTITMQTCRGVRDDLERGLARAGLLESAIK
jgi:ribonuclease P protein component